MVITITIEDKSADQIRQGFATATGWSDKTGVTVDDWIKQKAIAWLRAVSVQGLVNPTQKSVQATVAAISIT